MAWSKGQHSKFQKTMQRKRKKTTSIPLEVIPGKSNKKQAVRQLPPAVKHQLVLELLRTIQELLK